MSVGLPAFAVALLGLLYCAHRDQTRRKHLLFVSVFSTVCMIATIFVLRWDPLGVVAWYMD
jgi:hypothetical protein